MKMLLFLMHQIPSCAFLEAHERHPWHFLHHIYNGYYMPCVAMAGLLTCCPVSNAFPLNPNDR